MDVEMSEAIDVAPTATAEVPTVTDSDVKMDVTTSAPAASAGEGMELDGTDVDEEKKMLAIRQGACGRISSEEESEAYLWCRLYSRVLLRRL